MADIHPLRTTSELSRDQKDRFRLWLTEHGPHTPNPCPYCNCTEWIAGNHFLYHPNLLVEPGYGDFVHGLALVYLSCAHCGFLFLFNAGAMDLGPP